MLFITEEKGVASYMDERIKKVILNLLRNNMAGYFVENKEELLQLLATLIKKGEKIGCGDSVTLEETEEAIHRARQVAAPLDAKSFNKNTPCTKLDKCIDCNHEERICNDFVLIARQFVKDRIKVIIVNQAYGY